MSQLNLLKHEDMTVKCFMTQRLESNNCIGKG